MDADRIKWDERYQGEEYFFSLGPSRFLADSLELVSSLLPGRRALDLACGEGRNSIYLALCWVCLVFMVTNIFFFSFFQTLF